MLHLNHRIAAVTIALLTGLALAVAPAVAQAAAGGHRTTFDEDFDVFVVNDLCGFPITITGHQEGFQVVVTANDNTIIRAHITEQDVFSANGNTLTSFAYQFGVKLTFDSDGNPTVGYQTGTIIRVPLPNGETYMAAGRAEFLDLTTDFVTVPTNGVSRNLDDFCAAMSA
jgi:hypothetical protein